jgi:pentatricopeptide repeat protein
MLRAWRVIPNNILLRYAGKIRTYKLHQNSELYAINAALKTLCEKQDITAARSHFDSMASRDVISYNIMIDAYAKLKQFEHAELLLFDMNIKGFIPDLYTFTSLISSYFQANHIEQGEKLVKQMQSFNLTPNQVTIGAIIAGYCRSGMLVRARIFLSEKEEEFGTFSTDVYNVMLS